MPAGNQRSLPVQVLQKGGVLSVSGATVSFAQCRPGSFGLPSSTDCTPCANGTFTLVEGQTACDTCAPGTEFACLPFQFTAHRLVCSQASLPSGAAQQPATIALLARRRARPARRRVTAASPDTPRAKATPCAQPAQVCFVLDGCLASPCFQLVTVACLRAAALPAGFFYAGRNGELCSECPPGRVTAREGAAQCDNCTAGSYQASARRTQCLPCAVGE